MITAVALAALAALLLVAVIAAWRQRQSLATGAAAVEESSTPVMCIVCSSRPATHYVPVIRAEPRSETSRLHQTTPAYVIANDEKEGPELCEGCRRGVERDKEGGLASIRAQCGEFNARIEREIARIESEAILAAQRRWAERIRDIAREHNLPTGTPLPLALRAASAGTLTLPPARPAEEEELEPS